MRLLIAGACGFVGSTLARTLAADHPSWVITGLDSFARQGSEINRRGLAEVGVTVRHGDVRLMSDLEGLGEFDWVIDAAANPSVLAGTGGGASARQLLEHNLGGTLNLLECCRQQRSGFILLSTSRVYSIPALASVPVKVEHKAFTFDPLQQAPHGVSIHGVSESFDTSPPVSLYGTTKRCSELLALEYSGAFEFPVWINRCGVMAGSGQFGRPEQGIFAFWIHAWAQRRPLTYIGFGGTGHQVRDCLHPSDLARLISRQMQNPSSGAPRIANVSGGAASAISLAQLSDWCSDRFGSHAVAARVEERPFDIPWAVLDSTLAKTVWDWSPACDRETILKEIAHHAEVHPEWLALSGVQ